MKILNINLDKQRIGYILLTAITILIFICVFILLMNNRTIEMTTENYTTILKNAHLDISKYAGKKVHTSGYIFRAPDFSKTQFVVARDMLISDDSANIVGFLCEYPYAHEFENNIWVEIYGTIIKGDYYGPIPIIKVNNINKITTPNDTFVYPPN